MATNPGGWRKAAFIMGIVALLLCWIPILGLIASIGAIVVSIIALKKVKSDRRLIILSLIMGIAALLVYLAVILFLSFLIWLLLSIITKGFSG